MEIILIILFLLLSLFLYVLFRLIKWIFKEKARINWTLALLGIIILTKIIILAFFTKMEFIQSKVYPDLYLIKNPISDRDSRNKIIQEMVIQKVNTESISSMRFYEYYKGWGSNPFGEAGTAHFIEYKEDPGGFSSELLEYYERYRIAKFDMNFSENNTFGIISYYQNGNEIKTDTIIKLDNLKQKLNSSQ